MNLLRIHLLILFLFFTSDTLLLASDNKTLNELLKKALNSNTLIQQAYSQVKRQDGRLISARSNFYPDVVLDTVVSHESDSRLSEFSGARFGANENWSVDVLINQKLYTGGRNSATYKKAKSLKAASQFRINEAKNHLGFLIREQHARYMLADEKILLLNQTLKRFQKELNFESLRVQHGKSPAVYVKRIQLQIQAFEREIVEIQSSANGIVQQLREFLSLNYNEISDAAIREYLSGELEFQARVLDRATLLRQAMKQRGGAARFRKLIEAAEMEVEAVKSNSLPDISFFAGYGFEKDEFANNFGDSRRGWKVGLSGQWRIFDSGETRGLVKTAKAELEEREYQKKEFEGLVRKEITIALNSLDEAKRLKKNSVSKLQNVSKMKDQVKGRFSIGKSDHLSLVNAELQFHFSQMELLDARYKMYLGNLMILRAVGEAARVDS